jgi:hypothetical protein
MSSAWHKAKIMLWHTVGCRKWPLDKQPTNTKFWLCKENGHCLAILILCNRRMVFSMLSDLRLYHESEQDKKLICWKPSAWGCNWATLFLGEINTGTWPSMLGESQIWDNNIWSRALLHLDSRKTALGRPSRNCKLQNHPLIREGAPHQQTHNCLTIIKRKLVTGPKWVHDTKIDWLTGCRS